MKIAVDVSVFALGHYYPRQRAGIYRTVEQLITGLHHAPDCELQFYLGPSLARFQPALKNDRALQEVPVILGENPLLDLLNPVIGLNPARSCPEDLGKMPLYLLSRWLDYHYSRLDVKAMLDTAIFHSPFHPLPQRPRGLSPIQRFITLHDLIPKLYPQYCTAMSRRIISLILDGIQPDDWILVHSQATREDVCRSLSHDPARILVTPLAASSLFHPCRDADLQAAVRQKYSIPEGPYVLSVNTLEPRKNLAHLIRCFAELVTSQRIPDLSLVLAGAHGWKTESLYATLAEYPLLKDRIILSGFVADADLAALYSGALVFAYPSFYEGFGLPPLEAMQCGTPVITSDTSSLPEVVGSAGVMLAPDDSVGLCQSLWQIYSQPALQAHMSEKSLVQAGHFRWESYINQTLQAYRGALGG